MNIGEVVAGQRNKWDLKKKLGEGDAGEVFLVESLLEGKPAILKSPRFSALTSDVLRQSSQIKSEGRILESLTGFISSNNRGVHTPNLLDQSPPEAEFGGRYFIVIEQASGVNLSLMDRAARFNQLPEDIVLNHSDHLFLQRLIEKGEIPEYILLRIMVALLDLFEKIHFSEIIHEQGKFFGLIWNDVKPDHIFWDPSQSFLTVIDWGNAQLLQADGVTTDRQYSINDDYYQFVTEIGHFIREVNPGLYDRLDWPRDIQPGNAFSEGIRPLRETLYPMHAEMLTGLEYTQQKEAQLVIAAPEHLNQLDQIDIIQNSILDYGEIPNLQAKSNLYRRMALKFAEEKNVQEFRHICNLNSQSRFTSSLKWEVLEDLSNLAEQSDGRIQDACLHSLSAGLMDEWPSVLWELLASVGDDPLPLWWDDMSRRVRQIYLDIDPNALPPYMAISRLYFTLQSQILEQQANGSSDQTLEDSKHHLLQIFHQEVIEKWKDMDPPPPNSGIGYQDVEGLIDETETHLPGTEEEIKKILAQPLAHARMVIDAWNREDFDKARRGLRSLLVWDPHRRRLLNADRAIMYAPSWLSKIRLGAKKDEPFYDFLTEAELAGRELRNRVARAGWLDLILEAFARLRKGEKPVDLVMDYPDLSAEMPWLYEYRSRETISLPRSKPLSLDRANSPDSAGTVNSTKESAIGWDQEIQIENPLDTWVPEARGSSARVFSAIVLTPEGRRKEYALKIMRPNRADYALPLFQEEIQILSSLRGIQGVTPMLECGFIQLDEGIIFPEDNHHGSANHLSGHSLRYPVGDAQNMLVTLEDMVQQSWLPYLILEKRENQHNLMVYCDAGQTRGWFLPLREALFLTIQICDILQLVHDRNITYRDHKILHYYWDTKNEAVAVIDWNIAKHYPQGLSSAERQFDIVQFGARALHHILTGRPALGALPLGPNRPEEIEQASLNYPVQWTYDDERLPARVKEIVDQSLNQGYANFRELQRDLFQVYEQLKTSN